MKKIGIVGGVAWPSTVEYYTELCRRSEEWHRARDPNAVARMPELSIESLDLATAVSYLGSDGDEESWSRFDDYHRAALIRLEGSGADFALIASNTPHHRFEAITRGVGIPVISILDAAARECARIGVRRVLLLGTALTMRSAKFREGFARHGVRAEGPRSEAARVMTVDLIAALQRGRAEGAAARLREIAKLACPAGTEGQPAICLACTELPLAFPEQKGRANFEDDGTVYINANMAHVAAALDVAVAP